MSVPVGDELVGRIVDPLGNPVDGQGPLGASESRLLEFKAPGVVSRQPVFEPLQTGIKAIDSMIPVGRASASWSLATARPARPRSSWTRS